MANRLTLTPFLLKEIKKLSELGHFDRFIYDQLKIPKTTWYDWKAASKKIVERLEKKEIHESDLDSDGKLLSELSVTVKEARAKAVTKALLYIHAAAKTNWNAARWFLETIAPDLYGKREAVDLKHSGIPENVTVNLIGKDPE